MSSTSFGNDYQSFTIGVPVGVIIPFRMMGDSNEVRTVAIHHIDFTVAVPMANKYDSFSVW